MISADRDHDAVHPGLDMAAYDRYLAGELDDYEFPADEVDTALAGLPSVPEFPPAPAVA